VGIEDAIFIDDMNIRTGPPPTYAKLQKKLKKKMTKISTSYADVN